MPIYHLFEEERKEDFRETLDPIQTRSEKERSSFFSSLMTRFCFLLLVIANCAWLLYNTLFLVVFSLIYLVTFGKVYFFKKRVTKFFLNFRRSLICALALLIGLFSPPFGIMVACTYFLMYDKAGMEEVVPAPLQAQFKEIFHTER